MESLGGRKFLMAVVIIIAGTAIELIGKSGLSATMATFLVGILSAFSAANVISTVRAPAAEEAIAPPIQEPVSVPEPVEDPRIANLVEKQSTIETALEGLQKTTANIQKTLVTLISSGRNQ